MTDDNGRSMRPGKVLRRVIVLLAAVGALTGMASPALADDWNWGYLPYAQYTDYGGHVVGVQTALTAREYYLCGSPGCVVDGDFGGNTFWAVWAFQENMNLYYVDGEVGWETWGALQGGIQSTGGSHPNYMLEPYGNTSYYDGIYDSGCTWNSFINNDAYPSAFDAASTWRMGLTYLYEQPQYSNCTF
ncbi:MAG: peptidoglycan-binding domain-containing protein [Acidimicrobiales bacterium]